MDINTIQHDELLEVGAEWLCLQAIEELGIAAFLATKDWDNETINKALALLVSRAVYPASKSKTSQWMESSFSITELIFKQIKALAINSCTSLAISY